MSAATGSNSGSRPILQADTAADLMRSEIVSLRDTATIPEAVATLTQRGLNACPVVDAAGRPVGVVSKADILIHENERPKQGTAPLASDSSLVRDVMTPAVFSVTPQTPAGKVVQQLVELKVHQLFIVDEAGVLVGVVTTLNVLEHLRS